MFKSLHLNSKILLKSAQNQLLFISRKLAEKLIVVELDFFVIFKHCEHP